MNGTSKGIIAVVSILAVIGLVMISSTRMVHAKDFRSCGFLNRQLLWVTLALLAMFTVSRFNYHWIAKHSPWILAFTVLLLIAVLIPGIGAKRNGARRWIRFLGFGIQPSEMAKLAVILFVAWWLTRRPDRAKSFRRGFVPVLALSGLVGGLILLEPDLGTAVLLLVVAVTVALLAGLRITQVAPFAVLAVPLFYHAVWMVRWRHDRLLAFLDPWKYYKGVGYQLCQSLVALGTGGATGVGLGESRQKLGFLPEAVNDFILAIIGEEFGLIGTLVVLGLFVALVCLGMRVAARARDRLGFLIASGVTLTIGLQALLNLAVVTGSAPTKGISLPFVSFGGSALFFLMCSVGLLLSVARQTEKAEAAEEGLLATA